MQPISQSSRPRVLSLHIIYDADGTMAGEFLYIAKKMLGLAHCAACDITHGPRKEKPEFTKIKTSWKVPMYNIHRDEMDIRMASVTRGRLPCVVARTQHYDTVLLDSDALEACHGDVFRFQTVLDHALEHAQFELEASPATQFCSLRPAQVPDAMDKRFMAPVAQKLHACNARVHCAQDEGEAVVPSF